MNVSVPFIRGLTGGGGTGIRWAESGVDGAESGLVGRNRWWRGRGAGVEGAGIEGAGSLERLGGKLIF